jgi:hypothetical protein
MRMTKREVEELLNKGNIKLRLEQQEIFDQIEDEPEYKYHNQPVVIDGVWFASQAEAERWFEIQLLIRAGIYKAAERQKRYMLPGGVGYILDHLLTKPDDTLEAEEVKGCWTREGLNKCKQFRALYPDIPLYLIKNGRRVCWEDAIGELKAEYFPSHKGSRRKGTGYKRRVKRSC